jgi:hypothetical protein
MAGLADMLPVVEREVRQRFALRDVVLKHPLPERSWRMLGLVHIDGRICEADALARVLLLKTTVAGLRGVRSVFIAPRVELDLPVFSSEIILAGSKRLLLVDVQRRGGYDRHDDTGLYDRLRTIRGEHADLLQDPVAVRGAIAGTFSPAACYVRIAAAQDDRARALLLGYLDVFLDLVARSRPLAGECLEGARRDFEAYMQTIIEHDPAVKIYKMFFGAHGGLERALDMFFGR